MTTAFYDWYGALPPTLQVFWTIALITTLIFTIQMILTFIGIGDTDMDIDATAGVDVPDGSTLDVGGAVQLFSVRNLINFLLGLGWGGVCLSPYISNTTLLVLAAIVVGVLFVYGFFLVFRQIKHLESNGVYHIEDCLEHTVDVYLAIPALRRGTGKVQVSFSGSVQELSAMTNSDTAIPSGAKVKITQIIDGNTVLVERL